jgi:hypothetical protein
MSPKKEFVFAPPCFLFIAACLYLARKAIDEVCTISHLTLSSVRAATCKLHVLPFVQERSVISHVKVLLVCMWCPNFCPVYISACIHTDAHMHTHAYTCVHTCVYTCTQILRSQKVPP